MRKIHKPEQVVYLRPVDRDLLAVIVVVDELKEIPGWHQMEFAGVLSPLIPVPPMKVMKKPCPLLNCSNAATWRCASKSCECVAIRTGPPLYTS
jgi:hypothetical protein